MSADLSILGLFLDATIPVQLIMVGLLLLSAMSWGMIIERARGLRAAMNEGAKFEQRFWSGIVLEP